MRVDLDRPVARGIRLEHVLYVVIVGGTLLLRVLWADKRPLHHDEAIHAYTSWKILTRGVADYAYDPVYHGPVLYYLGAALQGLWGPSDLSARLPSILCGTGLVWLAWPLRPLVGRREALAFALLVALSPTLGYYGRSLRHDVPLAFFTLAAVVATVHHVRSGRSGLAYLAGALAGLALATKEDAYLTAAAFGAALALVPVLARDGSALRAAWPRARALLAAVPRPVPLATAAVVAAIVFLVFYTSLLTRPDHWDATVRAVRYWWGQHAIQRIGGPWWYYLPFLAAYEPLVLVGAVIVLGRWVAQGRVPPVAAFVGGWAVVAFAVYAWAQEKVPWLLVPMLVPLALVAAHHFARASTRQLLVWLPVAVLTLWSFVSANYLHDALRTQEPPDGYRLEPLAYVQTTYDVPAVVRRMEALAAGAPDVPLVVSGQAVWPLSWYLRGRPVVWNAVPAETESPALVVDVPDADRLGRQLGAGWRRERFAVRGWWQIDWARMTPAAVARFVLWRQPWNPPGTTDAVLFAAAGGRPPKVILRVPPPALGYAVPPERPEPVQTLGDEARLREPRGVAIAADGSVLVADTKNHRVVRFDASGGVRDVWGGPEAGDAPRQFREPCGIAVAPDGAVYVADTWNHRVQRLDRDGGFVAAWRPRDGFWGPRAVAVAPDGRVFVADTGKQRVVVFDARGAEIGGFGGDGVERGRFVEPVGLAVDPAGQLLYVADTGNRRIQAIGLDGAARAAWRVPGWSEFYSEPYLAWHDDLVWATDAFNGRVNAFDATGRLVRTLWVPGAPRGIAIARGRLAVVDSGGGRVRLYAAAGG